MSKSLKAETRFKGDPVILILVIFLSVISLYAVSSSSDHLTSQLMHLGICFGAMFVFYKIDYRYLSGFSFFFLIIAFVLMVFTLLYGEKRRAIAIFGQNIQTFYLIGFLVVFYVAKFLASRMNRGEELTIKEMAALFAVIGIFCGGIAIANLSTALILFFTCTVVLFIANVKMKYLVILVTAFAIGGITFLSLDIGRSGTGKNRVAYYMSVVKGEQKQQAVSREMTDYGRQMTLAKAAIARSTWIPAGPGQGVIKKTLAQKDTDFVYSTVVEEVGIVGGVIIILLYLILFFRTMQIARKSDGFFGRVLAVGIGFWFTCQALVHIGVNCELLPATGQTLPLISRGGASLLFSGMMIGILLNISKNKALESEKFSF